MDDNQENEPIPAGVEEAANRVSICYLRSRDSDTRSLRIFFWTE
jgi:hypothetical protein